VSCKGSREGDESGGMNATPRRYVFAQKKAKRKAKKAEDKTGGVLGVRGIARVAIPF